MENYQWEGKAIKQETPYEEYIKTEMIEAFPDREPNARNWRDMAIMQGIAKRAMEFWKQKHKKIKGYFKDKEIL